MKVNFFLVIFIFLSGCGSDNAPGNGGVTLANAVVKNTNGDVVAYYLGHKTGSEGYFLLPNSGKITAIDFWTGEIQTTTVKFSGANCSGQAYQASGLPIPNFVYAGLNGIFYEVTGRTTSSVTAVSAYTSNGCETGSWVLNVETGLLEATNAIDNLSEYAPITLTTP